SCSSLPPSQPHGCRPLLLLVFSSSPSRPPSLASRRVPHKEQWGSSTPLMSVQRLHVHSASRTTLTVAPTANACRLVFSASTSSIPAVSRSLVRASSSVSSRRLVLLSSPLALCSSFSFPSLRPLASSLLAAAFILRC